MSIILNMINGFEVYKYCKNKLIINDKLTNDKPTNGRWIDKTINNVINYKEMELELQVWTVKSEMKRAIINNDEETITIDPKQMIDLGDWSIGTSDGCTIANTKHQHEFAGKAIHLSDKYKWVMAKDSFKNTVLIPLKK